MNDRNERIMLSLAGLSVGDALGQRFFGPDHEVMDRILDRKVPAKPWRYTDDTQMALSVVQTLLWHAHIDPNVLAQQFAQRFDVTRGYGRGAVQLLEKIRWGARWDVEAPRMFGNTGSYGNGAAMRVAPVGAFFAGDLEAAAENAARSARVTHAHIEGVAGAVAIAIAAALAAQIGAGEAIEPREFMRRVADQTPASKVADGIAAALDVSFDTVPAVAGKTLGTGYEISAQDTVPFCVWAAARHLDDYEAAFWATVAGLGDRDTTCAIVGGIVALSARNIPASWLAAREALPAME